MDAVQRYGTDPELWEWYYGEIAKLGLKPGDADGIFWIADPIPRCQLVPLPGNKTREQLEEIIAELKIQLGIEPSDE